MANTDHLLEIARKGSEAWDQWRRDNPKEKVDFSGVDFTLDENKEIYFLEFDFGDVATFEGATFGDVATFEGATFGHSARFKDATFGDLADFEGATFGILATFEGATFGDVARFRGATFGDLADFEAVDFGDRAHFEGATFEGKVIFTGRAQKRKDRHGYEGGTYFRSISFSQARFLGQAAFDERDFTGEADFSTARFAVPPSFRATKHRENLDWTGVRFAFGWYPWVGRLTIPVRGWTTRNDTVTRLQRLRGIAKEIHAVDAERDLFILERRAERGILWHHWWYGGWRTRLTDWWRPLRATVLMFLYGCSSNYGRSLLLPLVWLVGSNWGFYHFYALLIERPLFISVKRALFDLTFASAVPFGATARPAFQSAVKVLFQQQSAGPIIIPWQIQAASAAQGITNLVLVFLLGLALRNYFKFK